MEDLLKQVQLERPQHRQRLVEHVLAQLVCLGSHTITGILSVCGHQFKDWTADYRMYGRERVDPQCLFAVSRAQLCAAENGPLVTAMDDTRIRKTGRKVFGAKYTRDPLGPPFHVNFIRAQRFLQISAASTAANGQARMIPVDWVHAPTPDKPSRKADEQTQQRYKEQCKNARIGLVGVQRITHLRQWMNDHDAAQRELWTVVDGSFTNEVVLKHLPANTTLVGRIRSDAKLYHLPEQQPSKGRKRAYGRRAPTPEQLRQDDEHPWEEVTVHYGGEERTLRAKRITPVRWRSAGQHQDLQMIVIAPTSYRLSKESKLLYRNPAYLICTDPTAPLQQVVQRYLWRWDIEVNFRDEKTLLGLGEAQVRTRAATQNVTALAVAAYSLLLLAAERCRHDAVPIQHLPAPKWQNKKPRRATTRFLIQNLRYELWARSLHFSSFAIANNNTTKPQKSPNNLESALFYATRYS